MGNTATMKQREVEFKLHIAIDFGTDGCGIAFGHNRKVHIYDRWRGGNRKRKNKTKCQILLGDNDQLLCYGDNAKMMYCEADKNTSIKWKFFERFKMSLYDKNIKKLNVIDIENDEEKEIMNEVDISNELTATNGDKCDSEKIFIIAFQHLQKLSKEYLHKITSDEIMDDEIQWILTVPAIWSESAKNKMKDWIIKAGLVDATIKNQCIIVYEPDCAALALKQQLIDNQKAKMKLPMLTNPTMIEDDDDNDNKTMDEIIGFNEGDRYILIDAGGGTVDIACHEILKDGNGVEEIIHPTGDKWGSCYIDDLYIKLLNEIFSKEWMDEYRQKTPGKWVEIMDYFQYSKCSFYEDINAKSHDVMIPFEFLCFLEEKCSKINTKPEAIIKTFRKSVAFYKRLFGNIKIDGDIDSNDDEKDLCQLTQVTVTSTRRDKNDEEYIEIDIRIWKLMFDAQINCIINHIQRLLNIDALKNKCKYLCLVGGFSSSLYFQDKIKTYFGKDTDNKYKLNVIIPDRPMLSVVIGAAHFGINNRELSHIKARRLKYTYGIKMFFNKTTARNIGIDEKYITENTTNDGMVRDCFKIIAKRNDRIELNETKMTQSFKTSQISLIPILRSNLRNPKIANDGEDISVLKIHHNNSVKECIITEFIFYDTMISVYSYPKGNINDKQKIDILYNN